MWVGQTADAAVRVGLASGRAARAAGALLLMRFAHCKSRVGCFLVIPTAQRIFCSGACISILAHPLPHFEWDTRRWDEVVHRVLTDGQRQAFSRVVVLRPGVDSTVEHTESVTYDVVASMFATVRRRVRSVARIAVVY